jgi:amino acid adenylation domain-containing protein
LKAEESRREKMSNLAERISALTPQQQVLLEQQLQKKKSQREIAHIIPRRTEQDCCLLSLDQERLWFLDQLEPGSTAYNLCTAFHLSGTLDTLALEQSFDEIVNRHEALRTTFKAVDGSPRQFIARESKMCLEVIDFGQMPVAVREEKLQQLIVAKGQEPFNLATGPLFRASLLRLGETEHILVITMHHIITDKLAHDLLWRELTISYDAHLKGEASPLPELPIQYADYALWQRQWMQGEVMQSRLAYWKQQLAGAPAMLELPSDFTRPAVPTYQGRRQYRTQPPELWRELKSLSRRENVTLFMTMLAAFYVLLYRHTGEEDVLVGTPFANREMLETQGLIGFLLNMLVLRVDLSGNPSFRELLRRVRGVAVGAYANNDLPFSRLMQELRPERDLSRNPLFQVAFVFVDQQDSVIRQPDLTMSKIEVESGSSNFDLMLGIRDTESDPTIIFEYSTDLFAESTIARMLLHFETLLAGIVNDPDARLSDLPLLTAAEKFQLLEEWNDTSALYPQDTCLHPLFEAQAAEHPDAPAVTFEAEQLSYGELNARANQVARSLQGMGIGAGKFVGVYLERSLEMVVALLGILKTGAAYVPLDPSYPAGRINYMLQDAGIEVLLTQERRCSSLTDETLKKICLDAEWESLQRHDTANLSGEMTSEQAAYVIYTSGSTGKPKGVEIPHRALINLLSSITREPGLSAADTVLAVTSLSFDIAVLELLLPLLTGARVVVASHEVAADGDKLSRQLAACGATLMQATPASWRMLVETGWQGQRDLRMLCGGEALSRDLADDLLKRGAALWNMYGPTETTVWSGIPQVLSGAARPTIGRGLANTQLYVLDKHLGLAPVGAHGELYIGGAGLAHGYLNRPDLTAEKFIPHPFAVEAGARLYRTGDVARVLPDGNIDFLGRVDQQVKLRGFRIETGEVETALNEHPSIRESVVIAREDTAGDKKLVAYFVADASPAGLQHELRESLRDKLPAFMIPSVFVQLDELPLTPNGKIDRTALSAHEEKIFRPEKLYVAPGTIVEKRLADIWAGLLELEKVGAADDFFALGGHSLTATRVIAQVRDCFQIDITLQQLFTSPTLEALARQIEAGIESGQNRSESPLKPVPRIAVRHTSPSR